MDLKIKILSKSQLFVWKCLRNSIGVKSCLAARGLNIDPLCPQCGVETETIIHALRDCEPVKSILRHLGVDRNVDNFFTGDTTIWLSRNAKSHGRIIGTSPFFLLSGSFGRRETRRVFQNKPFPQNLHREINHRVMEFIHCALDDRTMANTILKPIRWEKPSRGWVKLNTWETWVWRDVVAYFDMRRSTVCWIL